MAIFLCDHIDGIETANHRAILAIAGKAGVHMHLILTGMDDFTALPGRMIPFRERAGGEALRRHVALVERDEVAGRETDGGEVERLLESFDVARVESGHEVV